jgi:hypothetical protein
MSRLNHLLCGNYDKIFPNAVHHTTIMYVVDSFPHLQIWFALYMGQMLVLPVAPRMKWSILTYIDRIWMHMNHKLQNSSSRIVEDFEFLNFL